MSHINLHWQVIFAVDNKDVYMCIIPYNESQFVCGNNGINHARKSKNPPSSRSLVLPYNLVETQP
jgi:hypothetical protein